MLWNTEAGKPPTKQQIKQAQSLLSKPNSMDAIVIAMAFRKNGVTQQEVIYQFGRPHRNIIRTLIRQNRVNQHVLVNRIAPNSPRIRLTPKQTT